MHIKSNLILSVAFVITLTFPLSNGANILAMLPTFSPSHLLIEMAVVRAMSERHHNITVISVLPLKPEWLDSSMTYIQLQPEKTDIDMNDIIKSLQGSGLQRIRNTLTMTSALIKQVNGCLNNQKFQDFKANKGNNFDLIIYGYAFAEVFYGLTEHFNCPMAVVWPNVLPIPLMQIIGNPLELHHTPFNLFVQVSTDAGFLYRLKNILLAGVELFLVGSLEKINKQMYEEQFPADKYGSFEKAKERVAMVLYSHHFTDKPVRSLVPALIEIGGIHLSEQPKPLPKDIGAFVNSAEHGVIYFSLGTNINSNNLQDKALDKIYNVLSSLPQKILWKCDDESNVPGNSSNVLFRKWLPQADILAHPNVKLFFGHGGKGGLTEAKFYGVPIVGLPVFVDQPLNMQEVVSKGYGLSINHDLPLTEEIIYDTVKEVLENSTYAHNVKAFSSLYRDRPMSIKDNAVYWLEYLIRYKGAPHLQSPLKSMSFVEQNNLDVIMLMLTVLYLIFVLIKLMMKFTIKLFCCSSMKKSKND